MRQISDKQLKWRIILPAMRKCWSAWYFHSADKSSRWLFTIFCKEVNLHKGSRSDPEGILFLKPWHVTILYLLLFRQKWDLNINDAQIPYLSRVTKQTDALVIYDGWGGAYCICANIVLMQTLALVSITENSSILEILSSIKKKNTTLSAYPWWHLKTSGTHLASIFKFQGNKSFPSSGIHWKKKKKYTKVKLEPSDMNSSVAHSSLGWCLGSQCGWTRKILPISVERRHIYWHLVLSSYPACFLLSHFQPREGAAVL